eukprot:CAMPEP_0184483304 /NCGR_PEP_ID=MMETSP0113_2-20130426/4938_1 /TAXON_ID=91329 /ORGANISM="Norrisiella sphaerica, Strain BC52" /LENGTH=382 /DNA_ID=CAMNT_0026863613 /DNA_START=555 /DNA_END=1703 /DNA_ORIENTATION=-
MLSKYKSRDGGVLSLAQGIVHWEPPPQALSALESAIKDKGIHLYGPADGIPELKEALYSKLGDENGLMKSKVMVTTGANQAYTNLVVSLLDETNRSVLFAPYYFNHYMCLQMTGGADGVLFGDVSSDLTPDTEWLERALEAHAVSERPVKMVTICNPCNPTGVVIPAEKLQRIASICEKFDTWLVCDNTYEHFVYPRNAEGMDLKHVCTEGDHILNVFSFSKAFGMMGHRVGYIAYPERIADSLYKVQDTIPICPNTLSQKVALGALQAGRKWVEEKVNSLYSNQSAMLQALSPLDEWGPVWGGSGAIYFMKRLPDAYHGKDAQVVDWLAGTHGVCVIPGSACGAPGYIRLCYANLPAEKFEEAIRRLERGLTQLVHENPQL